MTDTKKILDKVGREEARLALFADARPDNAIGKKSITQAIWAGKMPASWFDVIEALCVERGIECPRDLFNFKGAAA